MNLPDDRRYSSCYQALVAIVVCMRYTCLSTTVYTGMRYSIHCLLTLLIAFAVFSCTQKDTGEALAKRYCSTCHLFPEPSMLPKQSWEDKILPEMAFRMGIDIWQSQAMDEAEVMTILQALPSSPMVTDEEWNAIKAYYVKTAPDSLAIRNNDVHASLKQFSAEQIFIPGKGTTMLTMIEQDPTSGMIYVGTRENTLYRLTEGLSVVDATKLASPPSDIVFNGGFSTLTCMGIMDPNDQPKGSVIGMDGSLDDPTLLVDSLKRPVHLSAGDLNLDGKEDLLVSAFGNFTGGLYAFEKTETGYSRHAIHSFPGTRKTIIRDFNDDGLPDIAALITQGDEHIALFTNRGHFRFSYRVLLKFPAVYGSSYFELIDLNGDGHDDILYTNGDNADYSPVLKPYHAVRIFTNDGLNHFSESWHHPMDGASMARASDYDGDGDVDIAAISFFPDFQKHPERSFIYFENRDGKFFPSSTPAATAGRWITIEIADVDQDDDDDILLGALNFPTGVPEALVAQWQQTEVSILLLRNNGNKMGRTSTVSARR